MKRVFVDTGYWIARINPRDRLHQTAKQQEASLRGVRLVTSEMVLVELLAYFSEGGGQVRKVVSRFCRELRKKSNIEIVPQTSDLFRKALDVYESRLDMEWSAVDCASMVIMKEAKVSEVLGADHHFEQAGYTVLMK